MIGRALGRDVLVAFAIAALSGSLTVLCLQVLRLLPLLAAARPSGSEVAVAVGLSLPLALEAATCPAFCAAAILVALRWESSGELAGARCAGLSPSRLWWGNWRAAVVCAAALAVISNLAGPWSSRRLQATWQSLVPRALVGSIRPGAMVELAPGFRVFAARRSAALWHGVVVDARGAVLAARQARLTAEGPSDVLLRAHSGVLRDASGSLEMRFERLALPLDVGRAVQERSADLPGYGDPRFARHRNQSSPVSFLIVAILVSTLAIELVRRPGWLVAASLTAVAAREVLGRVGESAGTALGAWLPVLALGPPVCLGLLLLSRRPAIAGHEPGC